MSKRQTRQDSDCQVSYLPESAYQTFLRCLPNPVAIVRGEIIVDINEAFLRMMRCRRQDLIGRQPFEFIHPKDVEELQSRVKQLMKDGPAANAAVCTLLRMDGTTVDVEASTVRLPDLDVWVTSFHDITEHRLAEEALRESEERFRLAFDNAPIGMVLVATDDHCINANQAFCNIVGYTRDELEKTTFQELTHPDDLPNNLELRDKLLRGEIPSYSLAKRYVRRDGALVDVMMNVSLVRDSNGAPLHGVVQIQDMTERKRAEEAVLSSLAALESAYALQSEFVRNMTHEVRTPLTGVIGCARALLDGITGNVSDEQRKVLKRIVEQAESLLAIVEEVLESATLAAGVQKLDLRALRLKQIVQDAAHFSAVAARDRDVKIITSVDGKLPVVVSDAQKLTRILSNLVSNAVKFTFEGSVSVTASRSSDSVDIVVADTGMGIPEDRQQHVFDAFVQLSYPGRHKPVGAGLGLSIVRELVDALGCSLTLSSVPGIGTAFTLHVPLRHQEMK